MSLTDDGCSECGGLALGECSRCGQPICSQHRTVVEEGPGDPGASGVFCPACDKLRATEREKPGLIAQLAPPQDEVGAFVWVAMLLKRLF